MNDYQQFIVIRHGQSQTNATNTLRWAQWTVELSWWRSLLAS
jgi:hypothetical protein